MNWLKKERTKAVDFFMKKRLLAKNMAVLPGFAAAAGPDPSSAEMTSRELIRLENLVKIYDTGLLRVLGLNKINLTIRQGEFVAIMGHFGSGKSTQMNILGCLDRPTLGTYYLDGINVSQLDPNELSRIRNKKIGFVF